MEHTLEHRIRQRAYEIWNAEGRADGKADEHWLAAKREVLSSLTARSPAPKASAPRKSHKRRQQILPSPNTIKESATFLLSFAEASDRIIMSS